MISIGFRYCIIVFGIACLIMPATSRGTPKMCVDWYTSSESRFVYLSLARNFIDEVIQKGEPFRFDQAVNYVLLSLPEGPQRDEFAKSLYQNIVRSGLPIENRQGFKKYYGFSGIKYYSLFLRPWLRQGEREKKIVWKAKVVTTYQEWPIRSELTHPIRKC